MERIILAVKPSQMAAAGNHGKPLAHLAYRVGAGPHLFRVNGPARPRGGLMVIDADGRSGGGDPGSFCGEVMRECAAGHFGGVVCRFPHRARNSLGKAAQRLGELCESRGLSCYVSEPYGALAPTAKVILPTALSGGSLKDRLEEAVGRFGEGRVAVWVDRAAEDFLLPSPTGSGTALTPEELNRRREQYGSGVFFSKELCAHYFTYMAGDVGHFVLFDDAGSLSQKLRLAGELGITTAFLPYETTANLLGELLK